MKKTLTWVAMVLLIPLILGVIDWLYCCVYFIINGKSGLLFTDSIPQSAVLIVFGVICYFFSGMVLKINEGLEKKPK